MMRGKSKTFSFLFPISKETRMEKKNPKLRMTGPGPTAGADGEVRKKVRTTGERIL